MAAYDITWITDQLAAGNAPMSFTDLDHLRDKGIEAIVNLCGEFCDLHEIEQQGGFEVYYLPIPDESAPDLEAMEKALVWLDEAIYLGKKILVHCRFGVGRSNTFLFAYLLHQGFDLKGAGGKLGPERAAALNYKQWKFLKKYSKKNRPLSIQTPSLENEESDG